MSIPLRPPTPTLIEGFSLEDLFRNPEIIVYMNDIKKALYFIINPHIKSMEKVGNWNVLTNRLRLICNEGTELRRNALKPTLTQLELAEREMLDNQLAKL